MWVPELIWIWKGGLSAAWSHQLVGLSLKSWWEGFVGPRTPCSTMLARAVGLVLCRDSHLAVSLATLLLIPVLFRLNSCFFFPSS